MDANGSEGKRNQGKLIGFKALITGLAGGLFADKDQSSGDTDVETSTERLGGDPFNRTIRPLTQEENRCRQLDAWDRSPERGQNWRNRFLYLPSLHRWYFDMRSPRLSHI